MPSASMAMGKEGKFTNCAMGMVLVNDVKTPCWARPAREG